MATTNYWWQALNAVSQKIATLTLPGIAASQIVLQDVGNDKDFNPKRGVSISPYGAETADPMAGTNASDDFEYPMLVMLIDSRNAEQSAGLETHLQWRQAILDGFQHKILTYNGNAITGHFDTTIKPGRVADLSAWFDRQTWTSSFLVSFKQRRTRP